MKSIRIETRRDTLLVDVVCDCGQNGLRNERGEASFKHPVALGSHRDTTLSCECGKKYLLHPQGTHIHVSDL